MVQQQGGQLVVTDEVFIGRTKKLDKLFNIPNCVYLRCEFRGIRVLDAASGSYFFECVFVA